MTAMTPYHQCMTFLTEQDAQSVADMALQRDHAQVEVRGKVMYFPDKLTFDHINYHYRMKSAGERKPLIGEVDAMPVEETTGSMPRKKSAP